MDVIVKLLCLMFLCSTLIQADDFRLTDFCNLKIYLNEGTHTVHLTPSSGASSQVMSILCVVTVDVPLNPPGGANNSLDVSFSPTYDIMTTTDPTSGAAMKVGTADDTGLNIVTVNPPGNSIGNGTNFWYGRKTGNSSMDFLPSGALTNQVIGSIDISQTQYSRALVMRYRGIPAQDSLTMTMTLTCGGACQTFPPTTPTPKTSTVSTPGGSSTIETSSATLTTSSLASFLLAGSILLAVRFCSHC